MKQDRLNNYLLVYCHKSITDTLDTVKIACANEQRKWHFEKFVEGGAYVCVEDEPLPPPNPPPPPPRFKTLRRLWDYLPSYWKK